MRSNRTHIILVLLSGVFCMRTQCAKENPCPGMKDYEFTLQANVYPNRNQISIGDTIWVEINEPTSLKDRRSGKVIDYSKANNLRAVVSFRYFDQGSFFPDSINNFKFIDSIGINTALPGSTTDYTLGREYRFLEQGNSYQLLYGVAPQKSGTFEMNIANLFYITRDTILCSQANFSYELKKNVDPHTELFPFYRPSTINAGVNYYYEVK